MRKTINMGSTVTLALGFSCVSPQVRAQTANLATSISFRNHVLPILTKATCNSGSCHGALAGKGGLKLTLRGFDPLADYAVLTRQSFGRRIVKGSPERSLFIQKPTMMIAHGGGLRIRLGSTDYTILANWIRKGAQGPRPDDPTIEKLEVSPKQSTVNPGQTKQITVRANYSDGHTEDVTRWVKFGSSENMVASVDDAGLVKGNGNGEAAITVWFNSKVTFARVISPFVTAESGRAGERESGRAADAGTRRHGDAARQSLIDELVDRKLGMLGIPISTSCADSEFIRRAFLDSCGVLPSVREAEAFLNDKSPAKRAKLVDSLMGRPEFVDYWTYKWCDLFLVSSKKLQGRSLTSFYNWIRRSVQENKPWDKIARELLTATGSSVENGAANFFAIHKDPIDLTETTTQAFLGMSVQCSRCHNHPLEKWTQRDYYQFANLFSRVRLKNGEQDGEILVLASEDGNINHPRLGVPLPPRPLDGKEVPLDDRKDRRLALADWITAPDNPYFAKALVNRVWRNFMGRGIVESEDDLRLTNPPTNQELLDVLAEDFIKSGYDVKRLIQNIMSSEAYQRSSAPTGINAKDEKYYSHYIVKRLPAEVMLDAMSQVTGISTAFEGSPKGTRAIQLRDSQIVSYFLTAFGRPERNNTCSCERQQEPSVAQALHLANGDTINQKLRTTGGIIDQLYQNDVADTEVLNELYLSGLSRYPSDDEKKKLMPILAETASDPLATEASKKERRAALEDLFWAVLTDREFLFNH